MTLFKIELTLFVVGYATCAVMLIPLGLVSYVKGDPSYFALLLLPGSLIAAGMVVWAVKVLLSVWKST